MKNIVRMARDYAAAHATTISVHPGDHLQTGRHDTEWDGWIQCTDPRGVKGWVPESYLQIEGDTATVLRPYCGTELSVSAGEELTVLERESGWLWCSDRFGLKGWVPETHIENGHA
jgi:hypothetical protein